MLSCLYGYRGFFFFNFLVCNILRIYVLIATCLEPATRGFFYDSMNTLNNMMSSKFLCLKRQQGSPTNHKFKKKTHDTLKMLAKGSKIKSGKHTCNDMLLMQRRSLTKNFHMIIAQGRYSTNNR